MPTEKFLVFCVVTDWVYEIGFSGYYTLIQPKNGFEGKRNKDFVYFFAKFWAYLKIFQSFSSIIQQFMPKIWQKMKKSLVQLAFNLLLHGTSKTRNPGFG